MDILVAQNMESAAALGWIPDEFGLPEHGPELVAAVKAFQALFCDLTEDGLLGETTFRRYCLDQSLDEPEPVTAPAFGDGVLVGGELVPIRWDRVVTPGEEGALGLAKGFKIHKKPRTVNKVITHWDVCVDAHKCYKVLRAKGISTHFIIDWDGTIYQLVDLIHSAWHAGIGWINNSSIGIDFNTPVYPKYNKRLVKRGQIARPVLSGWRINGWNPGEFLGPNPAQLDAYAALLEVINRQFGVPLVSPAAQPLPNRLQFLKKKQIVPGIYHHAEVDYPRKRKGKIGRSGKWDHAGVVIVDAIEAAVLLAA